MKEYNKKQIAFMILGIYIMCMVIKYIEFLVVKTDQTILAENVICKLFCLIMIATILTIVGLKWRDIGFRLTGLQAGMLYGLSLGIITFAVAYAVEFAILTASGKQPRLQFFITNFTLSEQNVTGMSFTVLFICIIGNIINVWAEEGLFRGLFIKLGAHRFGQKNANILQAILFGIWHLVSVVQWVLEGSMTIPQAIIFGAGYLALSLMLAYEWGVCAALTGTLWVGCFEHFFNNFISNALHTVTETGVDEMQIIRIIISNMLSLSIVLCIAHRQKQDKTRTTSFTDRLFIRKQTHNRL